MKHHSNRHAPFANKIIKVIWSKDDVGLQIQFLETLVQLEMGGRVENY
jgi:hypothetical protein